MALLRTYSGNAVNCTLQSDLFGSIQFGGISQTGLGSIAIRMANAHAVIVIGMDGAPVTSWTPGENGEIDIEIYQTSTTQNDFISAYNQILTETLQGDVTDTFAATLIIKELNGGSQHTATGVAFQKIPDKQYQAQAQLCHWVFVCANVITE